GNRKQLLAKAEIFVSRAEAFRPRLIFFRYLLHRAISLIDSAIGIRISAGIGVGDCQATERLARNLAWSFAALQPEFIPQRVVFIRVPMRPAIDGDRGYIASGIQAARPQCARELLANVKLHGLKLRCKKFAAADAMLLASRPAWLAGRSHHVNHDRFIRFTRTAVIANADRQIKIEESVVSAGSIHAAGREFLERLPVANCNVRVQQWNFWRRGERLFLLIRQLIADIGDYDVPTCEDTIRSLNRLQLPAAYIPNLDPFGAGWVTLMSYSHHRAVQTDTHWREFMIQLGVVCACG